MHNKALLPSGKQRIRVLLCREAEFLHALLKKIMSHPKKVLMEFQILPNMKEDGYTQRGWQCLKQAE